MTLLNFNNFLAESVNIDFLQTFIKNIKEDKCWNKFLPSKNDRPIIYDNILYNKFALDMFFKTCKDLGYEEIVNSVQKELWIDFILKLEYANEKITRLAKESAV